MIADLVIKNASLVVPNSEVIEADLAIRDGKIAAWSRLISMSAREEIDVRGQAVFPGIIDPHVHLGVFGDPAGDAATETAAALCGGVTTLGCYVSDEGSYRSAIPRWAETVVPHSYTDLFVHPVVLTDFHLNELSEVVKRFELSSFKVYMWGLPGVVDSVDDGFLLDVFSVAEQAGGEMRAAGQAGGEKRAAGQAGGEMRAAGQAAGPWVCIHAENPQLIKRAEARLGAQVFSRQGTLIDWEKTHPGIAESEAVMRAIFLSRDTEAQLYFVHVSSRETVDVLSGIHDSRIRAETTSPYLTLDAETQAGVLAKMVPPIRHQADCDRLWEGLLRQDIRTIGTDNTTLTRAEKRSDESIWNAVPGYPVLGTHLPVLLEEGYHRRGIDLPTLVGWVTENPARTFGLYPQKGSLLPGSDADLVVIDLQRERTVRSAELASRADFSLYEGKAVRGWPSLVIKQGRVAVDRGELRPLASARPSGRVLNRL